MNVFWARQALCERHVKNMSKAKFKVTFNSNDPSYSFIINGNERIKQVYSLVHLGTLLAFDAKKKMAILRRKRITLAKNTLRF